MERSGRPPVAFDNDAHHHGPLAHRRHYPGLRCSNVIPVYLGIVPPIRVNTRSPDRGERDTFVGRAGTVIIVIARPQ